MRGGLPTTEISLLCLWTVPGEQDTCHMEQLLKTQTQPAHDTDGFQHAFLKD